MSSRFSATRTRLRRSSGSSERSGSSRTATRYEEDDTITHAELDVGGATIYLSTPRGYASPRRLRETSDLARRAYDNPWVIDGHFVEVDDLDAHYDRARSAGATILREPEDPGIGQRIYSAEDLEGHRWMFGQPV